MDFLLIVVLAVVQGITEFLPISSDGHLVVVARLYEALTARPLPEVLEVEIVLHAGTLLSVLVIFWRPLWRLLGADRRVIGLLVVGTLPAVVSGLLLERYFKNMLENPVAAGLGFFVTAAMLLWASRCPKGQRSYRDLTYRDALLIGLFQALAPLPGVSRSGSTIAAGLALAGLRRTAAADFSFLLAVPAIGGAVFLNTIKLATNGSPATGVGTLAVGTVVAFLVGLVALGWLLRWIETGRLQGFGYYCLLAGAITIGWQLW
ncbi:MAG: undecaprenyl-diphosphate phosphatase [Pirellulales bacterium]